jgi:hypothetical protein
LQAGLEDQACVVDWFGSWFCCSRINRRPMLLRHRWFDNSLVGQAWTSALFFAR